MTHPEQYIEDTATDFEFSLSLRNEEIRDYRAPNTKQKCRRPQGSVALIRMLPIVLDTFLENLRKTLGTVNRIRQHG